MGGCPGELAAPGNAAASCPVRCPLPGPRPRCSGSDLRRGELRPLRLSHGGVRRGVWFSEPQLCSNRSGPPSGLTRVSRPPSWRPLLPAREGATSGSRHLLV